MTRRMVVEAVALAVTSGLLAVGPVIASEASSSARMVNATVPSAAPAGYAVRVAPKRKLPAKGKVTVTITGLPADVGLYVRLCKKPANKTRPNAEDCLADKTTSADAMAVLGGVWAVAEYPYGTRPAGGGVVDPSTPFTLPIRATFGSVDCKETACAIVVRRDHRDGGDLSYDRVIPVTFK